MKKVWYLREEKEDCIKAAKLFLYEKSGKIAGKLDLSPFCEDGGGDLVLVFRDEENQEIGRLEWRAQTISEGGRLSGKDQLPEELAKRLWQAKGEIQLALRTGEKQYLSEGSNRDPEKEMRTIHSDKETKVLTEELQPEELQSEELRSEELQWEELRPEELQPEELLPEELHGRRIIQLSALEEEMLFRKYQHNSFLLHGYYNYGHIVIDETKEPPRLGVPGNFYEREQMVAEMFGFPDFEPAREKEQVVNGTFGYYFTPENC